MPDNADAEAPETVTPFETSDSASAAEADMEAARSEFEDASPIEEMETRSEPAPRPPERRDFQPASPAAVSEAIDEVNRVITSLKQVLDTMEEILETLELAEVQKTADEREIQSLRNALRNFDRPVSAEPRRGDDRRRHGRR